jgi:hypothetical protein
MDSADASKDTVKVATSTASAFADPSISVNNNSMVQNIGLGQTYQAVEYVGSHYFSFIIHYPNYWFLVFFY